MNSLINKKVLREIMIMIAALAVAVCFIMSSRGVTFAEEGGAAAEEIPREGVKYKLTYPDGTVITENENGEPLTYDDVVRLQKEENWRKIGSGLVTDSEGKIVLPESWKKGMIKIVETKVPEGYTWGKIIQQIADLTLGSVTFVNPKLPEPTQPTEPTETEPTEPTETEPTETEPTDSTETEPTETDPTKSEEPTESTEPTESDKPTQSEEPTGSSSETDPTETAETTTTVPGATTATPKPGTKNDPTTQTPAATKNAGASSAVVNEAAGKTAADTGDRNLTGLWAGLIAAAAGVGVVATAVVLRKRKKN